MGQFEKNPNAVALGRLGGQKGGAARVRKLSAEKRKQTARAAAITRWHRPIQPIVDEDDIALERYKKGRN